MTKLDIVYKFCNNNTLKSLIQNNDELSIYQFLYAEPDIKRIFGYEDKELHILSKGIKKEYYNNGQLCKEYHVNENGKLDGLYRLWWSNGQLREECTYKDGKIDGLYRSWYNNGQLWKEYHVNENGELDGLYRSWWTNSQLLVERVYKDGKKMDYIVHGGRMVNYVKNIHIKMVLK